MTPSICLLEPIHESSELEVSDADPVAVELCGAVGGHTYLNALFLKSRNKISGRSTYMAKHKVEHGHGILSGHHMWLYFVADYNCWAISFSIGSTVGVWAVLHQSVLVHMGKGWKAVQEEARFEKITTKLVPVPTLHTIIVSSLLSISKMDKRQTNPPSSETRWDTHMRNDVAQCTYGTHNNLSFQLPSNLFVDGRHADGRQDHIIEFDCMGKDFDNPGVFFFFDALRHLTTTRMKMMFVVFAVFLRTVAVQNTTLYEL